MGYEDTMKKYIAITIVISVFLRIALSSSSANEEENFTKLLLSIPAKNFKSYTFNSTTPLLKRIQPAPIFLLNFLKRADDREDYTSYLPSEKEYDLISNYLAMLPPLHKKILEERLIGIYFVNNLIGSGWADYVLAEDSALYLMLIINPRTLNVPLSKWLTYRENSCYINSSTEVRVEVDCGKEFYGLMYVLLHETSHLVDYIVKYTPYVEPELLKIRGYRAGNRSFVNGIWKEYNIPTNENDFSLRDKITFYGLNNGPKLQIEAALAAYKQLADTCFVSLYGTQSWAEDFAELITFYHLTKNFQQPYIIHYYKNEKQIFNYSPMKSEKLQNRIKTLQSIYNVN